MAVINKEGNYMALPLKIRRGNPLPLDESAVWYDYEELVAYAQSNPVAYVGQILVHVDEEQSTVSAYIIQNTAGNLIKLASTTASGDLTEDVLELQGKVSALETLVGKKGAESAIVATDVWNAIEEVKAAYEAADTALSENLSSNYYNKTATDSQIDTKIAAAIGATYKPGGSVAFEALPELNAAIEGKVYNISNDFTTTDDFVDGAGKKFSAGTNVVCIEASDGVYKWDVLTGVTDLSAYATTEYVDEGLAKKVDAVEGSSLIEGTLIQKLRGMLEVKSVSDELKVAEGGVLQVKAVDQSKVTGLSDALAGKVNAEPGKGLSEENFTSTLLEKLNGIAAGAQANVIESIQINGEAAQIQGKAVNIPVASASVLGVVKGVATENGVAVAEDGTMSVNSVNVNKLVQTSNERLVLDGGNSTNA